jgi:CDGSH-type Zn-finger protein
MGVHYKEHSMSDPVIAARTPAVIELEPGTYWWCRCGRSEDQPFCDGSHKVTDFSPVEFTIEQKKRIRLCRCKHTQTHPYCDNTHRDLP